MNTQPKTTATRLSTALVITALIVILGVGFAAAQSANTGFITGTVWIDANGNQMREPNEAVAPYTLVYLRSVGENAVAAGSMVIYADGEGIFEFGEVAFGDYQVQAENGGTVNITLSEVNGTVSVDVPIYTSSTPVNPVDGVTRIFLPLVSR